MLRTLEVSPNLSRPPEVVVAAWGVHGVAGQRRVERYLLPELWCMHLYHYTATAYVDGYELKLHPGCVTLLPAGARLEYHYNGVSPHLYTHFRMGEGEGRRLPALYELGSACGDFEAGMEVVAAASVSNPVRANAKLWELLWQLAEHAGNSESRHHPSLLKALSLIELRLAGEIGIAALAREVGVSHNHLTRLFQKATGRSIVSFIRQRRANRAIHLLRNTTLPLSAVAAQIGVHDARAFNALIKKETGRPPSAWRGKGAPPPPVQDANPLRW